MITNEMQSAIGDGTTAGTATSLDHDPATCVHCVTQSASKVNTANAVAMNAPQPPPIVNNLPAVWDLVIADMQARDQEGRRKYGVPLQPFNGRDALVDAYQEILDAAVYLRQEIYERDKKARLRQLERDRSEGTL